MNRNFFITVKTAYDELWIKFSSILYNNSKNSNNNEDKLNKTMCTYIG